MVGFGGISKDTKSDCDRNALDPGVTGEREYLWSLCKTLRELAFLKKKEEGNCGNGIVPKSQGTNDPISRMKYESKTSLFKDFIAFQISKSQWKKKR